MNSFHHFLILTCMLCKTVVAQVLVNASHQSPTDGQDVLLTCSLTPFNLLASWINNSTGGIMTSCPALGTCTTTVSGRYNFSATATTIVAIISKYNATVDNFGWKCWHNTNSAVYIFTPATVVTSTTSSTTTTTTTMAPTTTMATTMTTTLNITLTLSGTQTFSTMTSSNTQTFSTMTSSNTQTVSTQNSSVTTSSSSGTQTFPVIPVVIGVAVFILIIVIIISCRCCYLYRHKKEMRTKQQHDSELEVTKNPTILEDGTPNPAYQF